jgi:hypothetical protein
MHFVLNNTVEIRMQKAYVNIIGYKYHQVKGFSYENHMNYVRPSADSRQPRGEERRTDGGYSWPSLTPGPKLVVADFLAKRVDTDFKVERPVPGHYFGGIIVAAVKIDNLIPLVVQDGHNRQVVF